MERKVRHRRGKETTRKRITRMKTISRSIHKIDQTSGRSENKEVKLPKMISEIQGILAATKIQTSTEGNRHGRPET